MWKWGDDARMRAGTAVAMRHKVLSAPSICECRTQPLRFSTTSTEPKAEVCARKGRAHARDTSALRANARDTSALRAHARDTSDVRTQGTPTGTQQ